MKGEWWVVMIYVDPRVMTERVRERVEGGDGWRVEGEGW